MRARSALLLFVPAALVCVLVGCRKPPPDNPVPPGGSRPEVVLAPDNPNADVGTPLFAAKPLTNHPPAPMPGTDPVVIPNCTVQFEDRQTVSAEVDGKIDLLATPMPVRADGAHELRQADGTVVTFDPKTGAHEVRRPNGKAEAFDPANPHPRIVFNPRDQLLHPKNPEKWVPHYALREGELVAAKQILCLIDDSIIVTKRTAAQRTKEAAAQGEKYAEEGLKLTQAKIDRTRTTATPLELLQDQVTLTRFGENLAQSAQAKAKAEADFQEAEVMLDRHRIKSRVDGIIRTVVKRPGEFVRAGEKIFEIQSTEKVRLEGNLDVQYVSRVGRNMRVTVEPAVPSAPRKSHAWHRQGVAGVAVTGTPARPLVVSAGLDGAALVWEPNLADAADRPAAPHNLPHPVAVRCVAATPPGKVVLAVTGGDDGKVRVWDLADPNKLPKTPAREPGDAHATGVAAVAVSPDGAYAATAAGREVFVWDLPAGKKLYALPESHRDGITSLAFTPQCELVTASKDRTLKRWKLGKDRAAVVRTVDHRSGAVDVLGVSPDGGRVLFDQDKARIDLLDLADAQTVGQLTNVGPSVAFATLAVFSPDHPTADTPADKRPYMVVTAGGEGDLKGGLQVWAVPKAGGRGAEVARLITPGRADVTCAAFSPHADARFLVVGTDRGSVHLWTPPSGPAEKIQGQITNIDSTDPRYVTVRVEMSNKDVGLLDRSAATVIVNPGQ